MDSADVVAVVGNYNADVRFLQNVCEGTSLPKIQTGTLQLLYNKIEQGLKEQLRFNGVPLCHTPSFRADDWSR